ncbi:MAG: glutamine amidotransferase family protein [Endomicrobium sp.]|jgi:glutamate synthase domain-containing protein 1|nr:glutamine amidotransferase family protein [Endomicrobium sp.]
MLREGKVRIPSGCSISGIIDKTGKRFNGKDIIKSIGLMHERSNGLGGGFAAYGIYPDYKDFYALHIFYDNLNIKKQTDNFLNTYFDIEYNEAIPTKSIPEILEQPIIWRYFVYPKNARLKDTRLSETDFIFKYIMIINRDYDGAYVFSSGKNMGAFKGVGYPEDIGEFYMLENYNAYMWTAHGRFPTNTPGWWGGAHPFTLLNWSIVHNGEISSYDTNRRFVEMYGYVCNLQTDTEVITYLFDLLVRKHHLSIKRTIQAIVAPFWDDIDAMADSKLKNELKYIRAVYSPALINGPFSIIVGFHGGMIALNDRIKLRPLVIAEYNSKVYVSSEESAIKIICNQPDRIWAPEGGEPVIVLLEETKKGASMI